MTKVNSFTSHDYLCAFRVCPSINRNTGRQSKNPIAKLFISSC